MLYIERCGSVLQIEESWRSIEVAYAFDQMEFKVAAYAYVTCGGRLPACIELLQIAAIAPRIPNGPGYHFGAIKIS